MSRPVKPNVSYPTAFDLRPAEPVAQPVTRREVVDTGARSRRPLEELSKPTVVYLHPDGKRELRRWAIEQDVKVHDLMLEALQEWAERRGIQTTWRVEPAVQPRNRRG